MQTYSSGEAGHFLPQFPQFRKILERLLVCINAACGAQGGLAVPSAGSEGSRPSFHTGSCGANFLLGCCYLTLERGNKGWEA